MPSKGSSTIASKLGIEASTRARTASRIADAQFEGQDQALYMTFVAAFLRNVDRDLAAANPEFLEAAIRRLLIVCRERPLMGDEAARLLCDLYATASSSAVAVPPAQGAPRADAAATIHDDYLICLEDNKKVRLLKRHLRTHFGMTPEQYRRKWSLPEDYPMIPPGRRSAARMQTLAAPDHDPQEPASD